MIAPIRKVTPLRQVQPGCGYSRVTGITDSLSDWKLWALLGLGALVLWLVLQQTPKRQERSVKLRAARAKYRGEVERIREEFA